MKVKKTKCIQKAKGKKKGKYLITLEVSDNDIEMFEDFALTYAPYEFTEIGDIDVYDILDYKDKYAKWMLKAW